MAEALVHPKVDFQGSLGRFGGARHTREKSCIAQAVDNDNALILNQVNVEPG